MSNPRANRPAAARSVRDDDTYVRGAAARGAAFRSVSDHRAAERPRAEPPWHPCIRHTSIAAARGAPSAWPSTDVSRVHAATVRMADDPW